MLFNVLMPGWLQTILLTLLLLHIANKTARKGLSQWRMEGQERVKQRASAAGEADQEGRALQEQEGHKQRGILHEESFHGKEGRLGAAAEAAVQGAAEAQSIFSRVCKAWRRLPGVKVRAALAHLQSACCTCACTWHR